MPLFSATDKHDAAFCIQAAGFDDFDILAGVQFCEKIIFAFALKVFV